MNYQILKIKMNDVLEILNLFKFNILFDCFKYSFSPSTVMVFSSVTGLTSPSLFIWELGPETSTVFSATAALTLTHSGGQRLARGDNWFG